MKLRDKCYMSNGNMQTNWAVVKPVLQMLSKFNFSDVYSTIFNTSDGDYRTYINYSQQEFLIKDEFDFTSFINFDIIVRSENDKDELIRRIGEKVNTPIESKYLLIVMIFTTIRTRILNVNTVMAYWIFQRITVEMVTNLECLSFNSHPVQNMK
ncbi:MAG: DUF4433 domain-containing protein [Bacteroidetes bacterium]|nr:DUF4433 domain-containing protein [Bacteroidota bacterium]